MALRILSLGVFCLCLLETASGTPSPSVSLDVFQDELSQESLEVLSATKKRPLDEINEFSHQHYWFYNFTIGKGQVRAVIDTSSWDVVVVHKRYYHPSPKSENLHHKFDIGFGTTRADGTGVVRAEGELYRDIVGISSLQISDQKLCVVTRTKPRGKKGFLPYHEGIIGLSQYSSQLPGPKSQSHWFTNLYKRGLVKEYRYGLAFGTNRRGKQVFGAVDTSLFHGSLTRVPTLYEWVISGDVVVKDKTFAEDVQLYFDSGTTTLIGPMDDVQAIFKEFGIKEIRRKHSLRGQVPCDKQISFGLRLPGKRNAGKEGASKQSKIFNVLHSAMNFHHLENGTCYVALEGIGSFNYKGTWLIGQAFFQGLYIDHNAGGKDMGFAPLKSVTQ